MLESYIEKKVCEYAKSKNWLTYKFNSTSHRGVPDRIFLSDNIMFFVEFKTKKGKTTKLQDLVFKNLKEKGYKVFIINSIESGKNLIDKHEII